MEKSKRQRLFTRYAWVAATAVVLAAILAACNLAAPAQAPAPSPTPMTGLQAVNGTHLYYEIIGRGAPVFVLHGSGGSHRYFLPYLETLSPEYQLIFYDQRGTGLSDGQLDLGAISIGQFVEDLEALRAAFGLEKISLMGHSRGAIIALAYALKYPAHLEHLILVDGMPVNGTFAIAFSETIQERFQHLSADEQRKFATSCSGPTTAMSSQAMAECGQIAAELRFYEPARAATVDWGVDENTLKNSGTVQALIQTSIDRMQPDIDSQLPSLSVPTLIIHGDFDPIPLASSEYLHEHIPGSQIILVSQSGHFPFIEQPEQFVAALRTFLSQ